MTTRVIGADTFTLLYDGSLRMVAVQKNSATIAEFAYDGDGRMVVSAVGGVTTYTVGGYFEWRVDASGSRVVKYYSAGSARVAMRKEGVVTYLFGDHLGSTSVTFNDTGNTLQRQGYTAFGEERYFVSENSLPFSTDYQYTGQKEFAGIGLHFYGARWYDSFLGRFITADSVVPDKGNPRGLDRYAYVANNPISHIDPGGHCWGFAKGMRDWTFLNYGTTCENIDLALTIIRSDETTPGQKLGAKAYLAVEVGAHAAVGLGSAVCLSNVAVCMAGAKTVLGIGGAATEAACVDGDCTNEAKPLLEAVNQIPQKIVPNLQQGSNKWGLNHIVLEHWFTSGKNAISRFGENIGLRQLRDLIGMATGDITLWTKEGNSLVRIIDTGQKIGTDVYGNITTFIKVVVDETGKVITAYPVPNP